jgi:hypothetical protein
MDGEELNKDPKEVASEAPQSKREAFLNHLKEKYPDMDEDAMYGQHMEDLEGLGKMSEAHTALQNKLLEHPKGAMMLADIMGGTHPAVAMKRHYSDEELSVEEGSPEYEQLLEAEKARIEEEGSSKKAQATYEENLEKSEAIVSAFQEKEGMSDEEVTDLFRTITQHTEALLTGNFTEEMLDFYKNGINHDKDTQIAKEQGEIGARNQNIDAQLEKQKGDGLPVVRSAAPVEAPKEDNGFSFTKRQSAWDQA